MQIQQSSKVAGIGAYLPTNRVTSDELMEEVKCERFGIPVDYMSKHIGIIERRVAEPDVMPSDLASLASESALTNSGVKADEIDLIIFAGITRDYEEPSTAHNVQKKIGAINAACFDVSNACLGFMTGLSVANAYVQSGMANTVLVCAGEVASRTMGEFIPVLKSTNDKNTFRKKVGALTVGDAGGAMVVQNSGSPQNGWQWFKTDSDGKHSKLCYYNKTPQGFEGEMVMDKICALTLARHCNLYNASKQNIEWFGQGADKTYCHQVGSTPHRELFKRLNLDLDKAPISYDYFGNLTSVTIPVLMNLNPPKPGQRIQFFCSGSGISVFQGGMIF